MRRTPLRRRTPLARGGAALRRTALRRKVGLRKVAPRRAGKSASEQRELRDLHTRVVMTVWARVCQIVELVNERTGRPMWLGNCLRCGQQRWLQTAHIEPVGHVPHLRYCERNAIPLCVGCHIYWWHKFPRKAEEWIKTVIGVPAREDLAARADDVNARTPSAGAVRIGLLRVLAKYQRAA